MPTEPRHLSTNEQAQAIGRAVRALRERAEISQETAAGAMGVTRQAWQQYETAGKPVVLRSDLQQRMADAIGVARDDILRERDRQAGISPQPAGLGAEGGANVYELTVLGRVRTGPAGPQIYGVEEPESVIDVGWMFGPNARTLRVAGDTMTGYVESGQLVVYDISVWPRRGEGCVVELQNGEVHVKEYAQTGQGVLQVRQRLPDELLSFPMADVKGVYAIRFRGG